MKLKTLIICIILVIICNLFFVQCSTVRYVPIESTTEIHQIDSIVWHDSIVFHHIYKEHYKDYTLLQDTLKLETEYSKFQAWADTTYDKLVGEANNKVKDVPVQIKWKEKIVYRDSLITKEIPIPVEIEKEVIPKWTYYSLGFNILILLLIIARLIIKIYFKR